MPIDSDAMMAFVRDYLTRNETKAPTGHNAWRHNGTARWEHTRRVLATAQKIASAEGADLDIVTVAAIFHDVAKLNSESDEHAQRGAEIAAEYLARERFTYEWITRVCKVIKNHTSSETDVPLEDRILRDADALDEVGALGIVWTAMNTGIESPSYAEARARFARYDLKSVERVVAHMRTATGREIAEQRLVFVDRFIAQLDEECGES